MASKTGGGLHQLQQQKSTMQQQHHHMNQQQFQQKQQQFQQKQQQQNNEQLGQRRTSSCHSKTLSDFSGGRPDVQDSSRVSEVSQLFCQLTLSVLTATPVAILVFTLYLIV